MKDLLLTDTGELEISNGDFVAGENYNQQQAMLLVAQEGEFNPNSAIEKKEYFSILISNCVAVEKNKR